MGGCVWSETAVCSCRRLSSCVGALHAVSVEHDEEVLLAVVAALPEKSIFWLLFKNERREMRVLGSREEKIFCTPMTARLRGFGVWL